MNILFQKRLKNLESYNDWVGEGLLGYTPDPLAQVSVMPTWIVYKCCWQTCKRERTLCAPIKPTVISSSGTHCNVNAVKSLSMTYKSIPQVTKLNHLMYIIISWNSAIFPYLVSTFWACTLLKLLKIILFLDGLSRSWRSYRSMVSPEAKRKERIKLKYVKKM